jgi:RHS repeat-associated protein
VKSVATGLTALFNADTNIQSLDLTSTNLVAATLNTSETFSANPVLAAPQNNASVSAVDGGNNTKTNSYQIGAKGALAQNLSYDLNGNLLSDGTNTYQWDADNRQLQINYPGSGNYTNFVYDCFDRCVKMVESTGTVKQFIWDAFERLEVRDNSDTSVAKYFAYGQTIGSTSYLYTRDLLASVRELSDTSGNVQASYNYDPFGRTTKLQGSLSSDHQYSGYYTHASSGLNLAVLRAYSGVLERWISRDPLEEVGGINLYCYVNNNPISFNDLSGLIPPPSFDDIFGPGINNLKNPGFDGEIIINGIGGFLPLAARVGQIHKILDIVAQRYRTTAGIDTLQGLRIFAGGTRDLDKAQRAAMGAGECAAKLPGAHAEITLFNHASNNGLTPVTLSTSTKICPACAAAIKKLGGNVTGPYSASFPQ